MKTALIIGASRGIGREYVRQLIAADWKVWATARHDADLNALKQTGAQTIQLDVADTESISLFASMLKGETLGLAVYVAGVFGHDHTARQAPARENFDHVMHTNVLGAMRLIPIVAPLVEAANGKFIFISSGMASIEQASASNGWVYRASKAALNMAVKSASFDYPAATLCAMSPGWVLTDMGGENAPLTVQQSVADMLRTIDTLTHQDSGGFRGHDGSTIAW